MKRVWPMIMLLASVGAVLAAFAGGSRGEQEEKVSSRAKQLHFASIVVDTHDDTTQRLLTPGFDLGDRHSNGGIDIPRMREGGLGGIFFSIWIPGSVTGPEAVKRALDQI